MNGKKVSQGCRPAQLGRLGMGSCLHWPGSLKAEGTFETISNLLNLWVKKPLEGYKRLAETILLPQG